MSLEYSGIEIRQFTHSLEIKREIPFCTRKRSETYVHCFMARYFVAINLLRKLAFALEEGYTFDEEDPDLNVDMHCLFKNFAYSQRMETFFYAPHLKGSPY